jgi:hypothetical protein
VVGLALHWANAALHSRDRSGCEQQQNKVQADAADGEVITTPGTSAFSRRNAYHLEHLSQLMTSVRLFRSCGDGDKGESCNAIMHRTLPSSKQCEAAHRQRNEMHLLMGHTLGSSSSLPNLSAR